jgi:hypothetical protein
MRQFSLALYATHMALRHQWYVQQAYLQIQICPGTIIFNTKPQNTVVWHGTSLSDCCDGGLGCFSKDPSPVRPHFTRDHSNEIWTSRACCICRFVPSTQHIWLLSNDLNWVAVDIWSDRDACCCIHNSHPVRRYPQILTYQHGKWN